MCFQFVFGVVFSILFSAPASLSFSSITFHDNYVIFRPVGTGIQFDLDQYAEILFLDKREKPTKESSLYWLMIQHNVSKSQHFLAFSLHKEGKIVHSNGHNINDVSNLKDMEVVWDSMGRFQVSIKPTEYRSIVFNWADENRKNISSNITHIAFKMSKSSTIRQKDSFTWVSNLKEACPDRNAIFSCKLKIDKLDGVFDRVNIDVNKFRKTMEMKLLSNPSKRRNNYDVYVGLNQTSDKMNPKLGIVKNNNTALKMDTTFGCIYLDVNISADSITVFRNNDSLPLFSWRDPDGNGYSAFRHSQYAIVQITESSVWASCHPNGTGRAFVNSCEIACNSKEENKTILSRFWGNVKNVFSRTTTTPPPEED